MSELTYQPVQDYLASLVPVREKEMQENVRRIRRQINEERAS